MPLFQSNSDSYSPRYKMSPAITPFSMWYCLISFPKHSSYDHQPFVCNKKTTIPSFFVGTLLQTPAQPPPPFSLPQKCCVFFPCSSCFVATLLQTPAQPPPSLQFASEVLCFLSLFTGLKYCSKSGESNTNKSEAECDCQAFQVDDRVKM